MGISEGITWRSRTYYHSGIITGSSAGDRVKPYPNTRQTRLYWKGGTWQARQSRLIAPKAKFWHMKQYVDKFGDVKSAENLARGSGVDN